MKVKALCNIIYGGKMYGFGEIIESDRVLPNTMPVEPERYDDRNPEEREPENEPRNPEEAERDPRRGRPARRGRGEPDERD